MLAQEPVEGAKSVLYSISEVYVAKDRIKIKVRDPNSQPKLGTQRVSMIPEMPVKSGKSNRRKLK